MFWTKFKYIGHSVKNLSPSQKTLRPPDVPIWLRDWLIIERFLSKLSVCLAVNSISADCELCCKTLFNYELVAYEFSVEKMQSVVGIDGGYGGQNGANTILK